MTGQRDPFVDNLLVRIHFISVMIQWTGLAPWEFESFFPGRLASTLLNDWKPDTSAESPREIESTGDGLTAGGFH